MSPSPAEIRGVMAGTEGRSRSNSSMAAKRAAITVRREKGGKAAMPAARSESDIVKEEEMTRGERVGKERAGGCVGKACGSGMTGSSVFSSRCH